eukprot:2098369-Prymnesium_polylepis.1
MLPRLSGERQPPHRGVDGPLNQSIVESSALARSDGARCCFARERRAHVTAAVWPSDGDREATSRRQGRIPLTTQTPQDGMRPGSISGRVGPL